MLFYTPQVQRASSTNPTDAVRSRRYGSVLGSLISTAQRERGGGASRKGMTGS